MIFSSFLEVYLGVLAADLFKALFVVLFTQLVQLLDLRLEEFLEPVVGRLRRGVHHAHCRLHARRALVFRPAEEEAIEVLLRKLQRFASLALELRFPRLGDCLEPLDIDYRRIAVTA